MNFRRIDDRFAVGGQVRADDVKELAEAGFRGARPGNEDFGQLSFGEIAAVAEEAGLTAVHIPVSSQLTDRQLNRFEQAMARMEGPAFGYCRSGNRAGSLYLALLDQR